MQEDGHKMMQGISVDRTPRPIDNPIMAAPPGRIPFPSSFLSGTATAISSHPKQFMTEDVRRQAEQANNQPAMISLANHVKKRWDAALNAKQGSGIECGIEYRLLKSLRQRSGIYEPDKLAKILKFGGSDIYMNLTSVKCRAAEAWIRDVMLPPGDKPWGISPTPEPDLPEAKEVMIAEQVQEETTLVMLDGGIDAVSKEQIENRLQELRDKVQEESKKIAEKAVKRLETRIEDNLVEGGYYTALGQFIKDLATFPTAFLKGPIIRRKKRLVWTEDQNGKPVPAVEIVPGREYYRVSPFDIYPSPGARSVQDGYLCERHRLRRSDLVDMIGVDGFNESAIRSALNDYGSGLDQWLAVDTQRSTLENRPQAHNDPEGLIDCIEYWGSAQGKDLIEWGMKQIKDPDLDYQITAWLIGRWVVMARINPHPLGTRPYYSASYEAINDSIWGKSPSEIMEDVQGICNACARNLINNLGIASGPQVEVYMNRLAPGEDATGFEPWKIWRTNDAGGTGNNRAVNFWQPDPMADVLLRVYQYFFEQASEQTGIPAYVYGSADTGGGAGKTASGLSMLMNAASKTLKGVIAHIDESVIKPSIREHWLHVMLYDNDINKIGDINIVARASDYLIVQEQMQIRQVEMLSATNNQFDMEIIGKRGRAEMLRDAFKSHKMNSDKIVPSEEEMIAQEQAQQGVMIDPATGQPVSTPVVQGGNGGPAIIPNPAVLDAAGNRQGMAPGATMPSRVRH